MRNFPKQIPAIAFWIAFIAPSTGVLHSLLMHNFDQIDDTKIPLLSFLLQNTTSYNFIKFCNVLGVFSMCVIEIYFFLFLNSFKNKLNVGFYQLTSFFFIILSTFSLTTLTFISHDQNVKLWEITALCYFISSIAFHSIFEIFMSKLRKAQTISKIITIATVISIIMSIMLYPAAKGTKKSIQIVAFFELIAFLLIHFKYIVVVI